MASAQENGSMLPGGGGPGEDEGVQTRKARWAGIYEEYRAALERSHGTVFRYSSDDVRDAVRALVAVDGPLTGGRVDIAAVAAGQRLQSRRLRETEHELAWALRWVHATATWAELEAELELTGPAMHRLVTKHKGPAPSRGGPEARRATADVTNPMLHAREVREVHRYQLAVLEQLDRLLTHLMATAVDGGSSLASVARTARLTPDETRSRLRTATEAAQQ